MEISTSKELQPNSISELIEKDKPKNLSALIERRSMTFGEMKNANENAFKVAILVEVKKILMIIGCKLEEEQLKYFLKEVLMADFPHYTFGDLSLYQKKLLTLKTFGQMKLQDLIITLHEYDKERTELAINHYNSLDADQEKKIAQQIPKDILKSIYDKIDKASKKEVVISEEAIKRNKEKIKTIELQYGADKIQK